MAVLSSNDRANINRDTMSYYSGLLESIPITKADLRAAIDAIDQWADDNAADLNSAIPQPARGALTAKQKARLFVYVINRRWEVL